MQKELINCHDRPRGRKRFKLKSSSQSSSIDEPVESASNSMDSSQESAVLYSATSILTETEFEQISEIIHATLMAKFYDVSQFKIIGEITDLIYALNLAELYIRKTILFCKNIAVFEQLQEDDQLILLKDFFTELMLVRIGYVFDFEREAFIVIKVCSKKNNGKDFQTLFLRMKKNELQFLSNWRFFTKQENWIPFHSHEKR